MLYARDRLGSFLLLAALAGAACGADDVAPPETFDGIDLLFVVNDSRSMIPLQARLGDHVAGFLDALAAAEGTLPNLHVGVVSTSVEEPTVPGALCRGDRGGELRPADCLADGAFARSADGNYAGTLADAAACMMQLGELGCPFEQPLEAMRRALDGSAPGNAGFLRADALLAVIFVTDEDDCSAADPYLYSQGATQYGQFSSYRCFAHGVRCDQPDTSTPGPRTGCEPATDGPLHPVDNYLAFLETQKGGRGRVVVGGLVPPASPVQVRIEASTGLTLLAPLCASIDPELGLQTWPSPRMHALADAFASTADEPALGSLCSDDWSVPLAALAQRIADTYRESGDAR